MVPLPTSTVHRRVGEAAHPGPPSDAPTCPLPAPVTSDPPICPTCLDPTHSSDSTRRRIAFWPGCQHPITFRASPHGSQCRAVPSAVRPGPLALTLNLWMPAQRWRSTRSSTPDADAPIPSRPLDPAPTPAMPRASATPAPGGLWHTRGPPAAPVLVPANSWLYVPLLHAAAGDLHADALEAWRRDSRSAPWWDSTSHALAAAAPVTADTLRSALLDHSPDGASSAARLAHSAANTPADARFHLGWAC